MIYGYHRTSTKEQHLDRGIKEIENYCQKNDLELQRIYTDQQTGKNFDRPRYIVLKNDILRSGDTLIITEVDRLGRNKQSTLNELRYFQQNNIRVMILELPTTLQDFSKINNGMAKMLMETINNMLIELYSAMTQAELEKKEQRQAEGIQAMKDRGVWDNYGRPRVIALEQFKQEYQLVESNQIRPTDLMKKLNLTRSTYYRYKKEIGK